LRTKSQIRLDRAARLNTRMREIAHLRLNQMKRAQQVETRNPH
jgi:hypothetical protein